MLSFRRQNLNTSTHKFSDGVSCHGCVWNLILLHRTLRVIPADADGARGGLQDSHVSGSSPRYWHRPRHFVKEDRSSDAGPAEVKDVKCQQFYMLCKDKTHMFFLSHRGLVHLRRHTRPSRSLSMVYPGRADPGRHCLCFQKWEPAGSLDYIQNQRFLSISRC